jgi:hypothetical protein
LRLAIEFYIEEFPGDYYSHNSLNKRCSQIISFRFLIKILGFRGI